MSQVPSCVHSAHRWSCSIYSEHTKSLESIALTLEALISIHEYVVLHTTWVQGPPVP